MTWRKVMVAAVVATVLCGVWVLDMQRRDARSIGRLADARLLPADWDVEDIGGLEVTVNEPDAEPRHTVLMRTDATPGADTAWRVTQPVERPGNDFIIETTLLANLRNARRSNIFEGEPSDGNGLTSPTLVARFVPRVGSAVATEPVQLRIGARSSFTGNWFADASDMPGRVFTVSEATMRRLSAPFPMYVDVRIIAMPPGDRIRRIALRSPEGQLQLTAVDEDAWMIQAGEDTEPTPADPATVEELVQALHQRRAARTVDLPEDFVAGTPLLEIELSDGDVTTSATIYRRLPRAPEFYLARRADTPYLLMVPAQVVEEFSLPAAHFQDRNLIPAIADELRLLRVWVMGSEMQYARRGPGEPWMLLGRPDRQVDQVKVQALISRLSGLRATGVLALDEEQGLEARAAIFSGRDTRYVLRTFDEREWRLRISIDAERSASGEAFALLDGQSAIHLISPRTALDLLITPSSLLSPVLLAGIEARIDALEYTDAAGVVTLRRDRSDLTPGWLSAELPREAADELGRRILALRWQREAVGEHARFEDGLEATTTIVARNTAGREIGRIEVFPPPPRRQQELEVRVKLEDGSVFWADRALFSLMERLIAQGRELK